MEYCNKCKRSFLDGTCYPQSRHPECDFLCPECSIDMQREIINSYRHIDDLFCSLKIFLKNNYPNILHEWEN